VKEPLLLFKNIKKARATSGLSQKELAKRLGVSDKTVSAYETGRAIPPTPTLAKIAEITNTSVSEILGVEKPEDKNEITERLKNIEEKMSNNKTAEEIVKRTKIDAFVGVVLIDKQKRIFLIKEEDKYRIARGRWNLPGGSVDDNEGLTDSAKRETKEETGYDATINSLLGCYLCKKGKASWIYVVFKAEVDDGEIREKTDPGVKEGRWFTKKEFLQMDPSRLVHTDMKLVYNIATENRGLRTDSIKFIDYDKE